jgi:integrase
MNGPKTNPKNDRVKREYLLWLKEAKQRSAATVEQVRHAIDRLETYTRFKDFGTFNREQAMGFKRNLLAVKGQRSGNPISIATAHHILQAIKDFLAWLHGQPEYRRRIAPADIAYLSLTKGEERQAHAGTPKKFASLEEYHAALFAMPAGTEVECRDRAMMALLLLTGMRDAAIIGLKMRDIDLSQRYIFQNPRHAQTKFSKAIDTFFLPVGEDVVAAFTSWIDFLTNEKGFGLDDPVFPKSAHTFAGDRMTREHWANAAPVRKCFKSAFARAGFVFSKPHSVRDTLVQLAYRRKFNAEQMKALSQNLGHDKPLTTFNSYGPLTRERQGEVILDLARRPADRGLDDLSPTELSEALTAKLKSLGA